jgi:formiminoglutamase
MSLLRTATVNVPETSPEDPRVGHLLGRGLPDLSKAKVIIVGFPIDEGVRRNGGRVGAAEGPAAIRQALFRMTPDPELHSEFAALLNATVDLGDLLSSGDLESDQAALGRILAPHVKRGAAIVVLGGGHETSLGHFRGYVDAGEAVRVLNWDAHPDVRPLRDGKGHSGSPFRQILEHPSGLCQGYLVAGLARIAIAKAHLDFLASRGGSWIFKEELDRDRIDQIFERMTESTLATFDLDAVDGVAAPGVSAPATAGICPENWLYAAELAGQNRCIRSMDLVELNPRLDLDGRTARLAAATVWHFLRGLCRRKW